MCEPLFLLGAGFNYDAKIEAADKTIQKSTYVDKYENNSEYPLLADLFEICFPNVKNDTFTSIEELLNTSIENNNFEPIQRLYNKIMDADCKLVPKLIENQSSCFYKFFNKFQKSSFLTYNYDSLLELFLLKLNRWYPHDGYGVPVEIGFNWSIGVDENKENEYLGKCSSSFVFHLHGSLYIYSKNFEIKNNLIELKEDPIFKFDPYSIATLFFPYEQAQLDLSYSPNIRERIIAPIPDKSEGLKSEFIKKIYSKARNYIKNTNQIIAIGYKFSEHDKSSYDSLIRDYKKEILVISPDAEKIKNRLKSEYTKIQWSAETTTLKSWVTDDFIGLN